MDTEITTLQGKIDEITATMNETMSAAETLQAEATDVAAKAQGFLDAANCFLNDVYSSAYCGNLAGIGTY